MLFYENRFEATISLLRPGQRKVHTMFVIGKRDMDANAASVRVHGKGNLGAKPRGEVIADILLSIKERRP